METCTSWVDCLLAGVDPTDHGFTLPETPAKKTAKAKKKNPIEKSADTRMFASVKVKRVAVPKMPLYRLAVKEITTCPCCNKEQGFIKQLAIVSKIKNGTDSVFQDIASYSDWSEIETEEKGIKYEIIKTVGICGDCEMSIEAEK